MNGLKCAVCGKEVTEPKRLQFSIIGKQYFFCSERCMYPFVKKLMNNN